MRVRVIAKMPVRTFPERISSSTEKGPDATGTRSFGVVGTPVRIGLRIEDLYRPVLNSHAPDDRSFSWPNHVSRPEDKPLLGRAKLRRVFDQSFERDLPSSRVQLRIAVWTGVGARGGDHGQAGRLGQHADFAVSGGLMAYGINYLVRLLEDGLGR
jgi:hypothetical protein